MQILGIKVDNLTLEQARLKVRDFLALPGQFKIFTPNPEMVVKVQKDEYFKKVLNSGDLNICDGFGLWLALSSRPKRSVVERPLKIERITGVDFMLEICQIAEEEGSGVYLLGTEKDEIVKKTAVELQKKFPKLKIFGYNKGPTISNCHPEQSEGSLEVINKLNASKADILFVAFGMGKQEKWIFENITKMPSVKIAIGVGGAFDYISGVIPRAPLFLRKIGLEWVYRLVRQPQRFCRIFNATLIFIYYLIKYKESWK